MVRFPRKRSVLQQPHLQSDGDVANATTADSTHILGDIPSDIVTRTYHTHNRNNSLSRCDVSSIDDFSSSSLGSNSTMNDRRRRRFRAPLPQFKLLPPPSSPLPLQQVAVHANHPTPPIMMTELKQRSRLQRLQPWRNAHYPPPILSRRRRRGGLLRAKHHQAVPTHPNDDTVDHSSLLSIKISPPPITTNLDDTSLIHMDDTSTTNDTTIMPIASQEYTPSNDLPTGLTVVTATANHVNTRSDHNHDVNVFAISNHHDDNSSSISQQRPLVPMLTSVSQSRVRIVPITPDVVMDHVSSFMATPSDIEQQYSQRQKFVDGSAIIVTPREITSNQISVIVTPERFDVDDDPPPPPNMTARPDVYLDEVTVPENKSTNEENIIQNVINYEQSTQEAQQFRRSKLSGLEIGGTGPFDVDQSTRRSSVPMLTQENHYLKLSHLYTTLPNFSSNPWLTGCSI